MKGNFQVRFLEEGERVTTLLYSAMTRIPTDLIIRENPSNLCHPCSFFINPMLIDWFSELQRLYRIYACGRDS